MKVDHLTINILKIEIMETKKHILFCELLNKRIKSGGKKALPDIKLSLKALESKFKFLLLYVIIASMSFGVFKNTHAQGKIMGTITTVTGEPIQNVCIEVKKDGSVLQTLRTDKTGQYLVDELTYGDYDIILHYRMEEKVIENIQFNRKKTVYQKIKLIKKDPVIPNEEINLALIGE